MSPDNRSAYCRNQPWTAERHSAAHTCIDYFFRRFLDILSKVLMLESTFLGIVSQLVNFPASTALPRGGAETAACRTRPESDEF